MKIIKASYLYLWIEKIIKEYGDCNVEISYEHDQFQFQAPANELAFSEKEKKIVITHEEW